MPDYDSPWKEMLEDYFPDFMAFFFPKAHADIDWSKGYESLDKELQQIVRDAELGKRLADKLMRVRRLDGEEQIVLIHTEIQGDWAKNFAKRMYVYNYRLYDRYDKPVESLAVLGDDSSSWRPNYFGYNLWGCEAGLKFPVIKLQDYNRQWSALENSDNPFALVVMAHLKRRATQDNPQDRLLWKMRLIRHLYQRGYRREDILELFRFIDWVLVLPEGLEQQFQNELEQYEAETKMRYVTNIERKGIEKGIQKGIQQGVQQGGILLLRQQLIQRFGPLPDWAEQHLKQASLEDLETWAKLILEAQSLKDIFTDE